MYADNWYLGLIRRSEEGENAEHDVSVPMPHNLQRACLPCFLPQDLACAAVQACVIGQAAADDSQCSKTCPKGLNPAMAIAKMKLEMATEQ